MRNCGKLSTSLVICSLETNKDIYFVPNTLFQCDYYFDYVSKQIEGVGELAFINASKCCVKTCTKREASILMHN